MSHVRTFKAGHDGKLSGHHVNDAAGNQEGRDSARTAIQKRFVIVGNHRNAADAGSDRTTYTAKIFMFTIQTAVTNGLKSRRNPKMNETVKTSGFLDRHIGRDIKIFYFCSNLAAKLRGIETSHRPNAACPLKSVFPNCLDIIADWAHCPQSCYNNPTHKTFPIIKIKYTSDRRPPIQPTNLNRIDGNKTKVCWGSPILAKLQG